MIIKRYSNGDVYVARMQHAKGQILRDWFMPKYTPSRRTYVKMGTIILPPEYAGKRIKFKVTVEEYP